MPECPASAVATPPPLARRSRPHSQVGAPGGVRDAPPLLSLSSKPLWRQGHVPSYTATAPVWGPNPGLRTWWPLGSRPPAVTFPVRLRDAPERTVLLPDELPGQLDVHVHLADPGDATAGTVGTYHTHHVPRGASSPNSVSQAVIPGSRRRKLRLRKVKQPAQGHTPWPWGSWDSSSGPARRQSPGPTHMSHAREKGAGSAAGTLSMGPPPVTSDPQSSATNGCVGRGGTLTPPTPGGGL